MTKNKELFDFVYQFVRYGHGHVLGRLKNTRGRKCKGCVEDTNAIIGMIQKQTAKEILKIIEEHNEWNKSNKRNGILITGLNYKLFIKRIREELHFVCYKCQNKLLTDRDAYKKGKLETAREIIELIDKEKKHLMTIREDCAEDINLRSYVSGQITILGDLSKQIKKQFLGGEDGR